MKQIFTFFICFCISMNVSAQITITQSDLPSVGHAWIMASDSNYNTTISAGGANQNWNYSSLLNNYPDTFGFVSPSSTPYANLFPMSGMAAVDPAGNGYAYYSSNISGLYFNGFTDGTLTIMYQQPRLIFPTPITYNDSRNDVGRYQLDTTYIDTSGNSFNVRIIQRIETASLCDGYGSLDLPNATYNNTLRLKITSIQYDSILVDLLGLGIYTPFQSSSTTSSSYNWVKAGPNAILMTIDSDSTTTNTTRSGYQLAYAVFTGLQAPEKKLSLLTYPNPSNDVLHVQLNDALVGDKKLMIYDSSGRCIVQEIFSDQALAINVKSLSNGIYHLVVTGNDASAYETFQVLR